MVDIQIMSKAITHAAMEVTRTVVQVMAVARANANTNHRSKSIRIGYQLGGPTLEQPTFHWSTTHKYTELRNFRLEENNIF